MKSQITVLPEWTYDGCSKDAYSLASAIALAGLEGEYVLLSAQQQRDILGYAVFGKKRLMYKDNYFHTYIKIAFGKDFDDAILSVQQVQEAINKKRDVMNIYYTSKEHDVSFKRRICIKCNKPHYLNSDVCSICSYYP